MVFSRQPGDGSVALGRKKTSCLEFVDKIPSGAHMRACTRPIPYPDRLPHNHPANSTTHLEKQLLCISTGGPKYLQQWATDNLAPYLLGAFQGVSDQIQAQLADIRAQVGPLLAGFTGRRLLQGLGALLADAGAAATEAAAAAAPAAAPTGGLGSLLVAANATAATAVTGGLGSLMPNATGMAAAAAAPAAAAVAGGIGALLGGGSSKGTPAPPANVPGGGLLGGGGGGLASVLPAGFAGLVGEIKPEAFPALIQGLMNGNWSGASKVPCMS